MRACVSRLNSAVAASSDHTKLLLHAQSISSMIAMPIWPTHARKTMPHLPLSVKACLGEGDIDTLQRYPDELEARTPDIPKHYHMIWSISLTT